jgi:hypothetical protein
VTRVKYFYFLLKYIYIYISFFNSLKNLNLNKKIYVNQINSSNVFFL